jgi:hypothetical protein
MESEKVRIIDKKGQPRFVMSHIANDKKLMRNYGFTVQDLKVKKEPATITGTANTVSFTIKDETDPLDLLGVTQLTEKSEKEVRAEYEAIFGKKAGNKKLETILKEIKEKK